MSVTDDATSSANDDISARLVALEQEINTLRTREQMYLQALDVVSEMVLVKGPASRIVYANAAFRDLYGMTNEQLQDMIDAPFNDPDVTQQYIRDDMYVFETGQVLNIPMEPVKRHDGALRTVRTTKSPIRDVDGHIMMTVGVFNDITEQLQVQANMQLFETVFKHLPSGVLVFHMDNPADPNTFRLLAANPMAKLITGINLDAEVGQTVADVFPDGATSNLIKQYAKVVQTGQSRDLGEITYDDDGDTSFFSIRALPLPNNAVGVLFENITEHKRNEEALRQSIAQEETIRAQQATLAELSTPLIPLTDQVVVMPLVGTMDSRRAQQVIETLLQGVAESGAQVAILDITGVSLVDTQVADAFIRAARTVQLLGAQVVLTGIRPEVAQTLVGLGVDLGAMVTRSTLQSGISYASERTRLH